MPELVPAKPARLALEKTLTRLRELVIIPVFLPTKPATYESVLEREMESAELFEEETSELVMTPALFPAISPTEALALGALKVVFEASSTVIFLMTAPEATLSKMPMFDVSKV